MLPQEVIRAKRDGHALTVDQIDTFIRGIADDSVTEGQAAAFAMAVLLRGMERDERVALTQAMARSGQVLDWAAEDLGGPVVDKHSTGGVGDKVSLILAPVVAACGGFVPMISGRGLGHTGGTLDKLDSIPGYRSQTDLATLRRVVQRRGCAIIGATGELAPADRRLYAIRDITGTVESIDLITASILSKKLAAGLDALVMDVKTGSGAFAAAPEEAERLGRSLVDVGRGAGLAMTALITDMNQVLGRTAGNALEVREAIDVLTGTDVEPRLRAVTVALSAHMLVLGGLADTVAAGERMAADALDSGKAAERFGAMVADLGGPTDLMARPDTWLLAAPIQQPVFPEATGHVRAIDVRRLGVLVVELGGGRRRVEDQIDPAVGLSHVAGIGEPVGPGTAPLALVHAADADAAARAAAALAGAFTVSDAPTGEATADDLVRVLDG